MRECYDEFGQNILRLTQWDLNRVVTIQDFEYEETPIVHFAHINDEKSLVVTGDDVTLVDGELKVKVPNELLLISESILMNIFIYDRENNKGINVENILLPVQPKPQPSDYVYVDNVDVVELSTLKLSLQTAITNAQRDVNVAISSLEQQYQTTQQNLVTQLNTAKTELENQVNNALRDTLENIKDGTPKGIFSNESDLANKEAGIYIFYNANDNVDDNGYLFYWDGETLSNRLFLYNGIKIGDGEITLEMISIALKYAAIEDYRIFESMEDANEYLTTNYAKAGQTIKVKENDKYKLYLIQSNDSVLSLSPISANSVIDDRLPTVAEANADTDYYINQNGSYVHYRLIGGSFVAVGGDSYSKTKVKTKVLYSFEEFEAFISELYEGFSEYAPIWLIFGFDDENNDISLGSGYLIFDDGSGSFDNALLIPMSSAEIPFTQAIRDEITANKRTRLYPLLVNADSDNRYFSVFNYDKAYQTEINSISSSTKQVKLIIFPSSTCNNVYIRHGAVPSSAYNIAINCENKERVVVDVYFIVDNNGYIRQIIYDCGDSSEVIHFPPSSTAVKSLYLTSTYSGGNNFTVRAFGEG